MASISSTRRSADRAREAAARRFAAVEDRRGVREAVEAFRYEQRSGAGLLAGGLAYRLFLWLVPFGLLIAGIASFWVRRSSEDLQDAAKGFGLGGVAARSAASAIEEGSRARWYLLIAGLSLMLWAGIAAVRALAVTSRLAWGLEPARLGRPLRASAVFAAIAALGLGGSVGASAARHSLGVLGLVATLASVAVYAALALFVLAHLPRPAGATWRAVWPGALAVGVGLAGVHVFLAYFLAARLERAPSLYGSLGASTVVLLVLFLIARLLVAAMFLNAAVWRQRREARE